MPARRLPVRPNLNQLKRQAKELLRLIRAGDPDAVEDLHAQHPEGVQPAAATLADAQLVMTYAANLGRDRIIRMLHDLGATDGKSAGRAALQGKIETARMLYDMAGRPPLPAGALGGPAYTLTAEGTALVLSLGARVVDDAGRRLAPVDIVLETDARKPAAKHAILGMYERHGLEFPDTPTMALHRRRIDLLDKHLNDDAP